MKRLLCALLLAASSLFAASPAIAQLLPATLLTTDRAQLWQILGDGSTAVWYQPGVAVTGTLNASLWANWINGTAGTAGDLAQATGANQPIILPWTGANYAWFPGVAGNSYTAPINDNVTNFDVQIYVAQNNWSSGAEQSIFHSGLTDNSVWVYLGTTGRIRCNIYAAAPNPLSDSATGFGAGVGGWIRVRYVNDTGAGQYSAKFYTSTDPSSSNNPTWTLLGAEKTGLSGTPNAPTGNTIVGAVDASSKIYRIKFYNGPSDTTGVLIRDFDPSLVAETTTNGATFVAATGETWTLNNTGATPAQIVGSPSLLGDGVAHRMQSGAVTIPAPYTIISVEREITWTSGDVSFDGRTVNSFAAQQITGTPQIKMWDGTTASASVSPTLGTYYIVTASQSAAGAATIQLNAGTAATGTLNATGLGGFTDWADGAGANFCNKQKKEGIILTEVPSAAKLLAILQRLSAIHGIAL